MVPTLYHRLILPADANHKNTLYAGFLLRLALEAGYATEGKTTSVISKNTKKVEPSPKTADRRR
jgi:acyl-CoA hydrolase